MGRLTLETLPLKGQMLVSLLSSFSPAPLGVNVCKVL